MSNVTSQPGAASPALRTQLFIEGAYVDALSGETFETLNPATNEILARVAAAQREDVDRAVRVARRAFDEGPWPRMKVEDRSRIIRRLGDLIMEHADELARLECLDAGKPLKETRGHDIPRAANNCYFFAEMAPHYVNEAYPTHGQFLGEPVKLLSYTRREPIGVAGLITPWNSPLMQATWKVAPCLVCGNTAILKPSEMAPLTSLKLGELAQEAGVPDGVLNILTGLGPGAGAPLTAHPQVDLIAFTGGCATGRAIMQAASVNFKRLCLEMGGKSPNIVFADADLDLAVRGSVRAMFRHAGQVCLAGTRLFVQESIYDRFLSAFVDRVEALRLGDPLEPDTDLGPLISRAHLEKVMGYIELGKREGGRLLTGGERPQDPTLARGNYLRPTIFENIQNRTRIAQEEIFGPVLVVMPFKEEEEVLQLANDTPFGLAAFVWTQDINRALRLADALKTGMVWINSFFIRDLHTPFGGAKQSGLGREGGRYALEFFTEPKFICIPY